MTDVSTHTSSVVLASSIARVATPKARNYMIQMCKHFGHKLPVKYDDAGGRLVFEQRVCEFDTTQPGILTIALKAEDERGLHAIEDIVERHLRRFAFKEELVIAWVRRG
jgi:hypothetical protein